MDFNDKLRRLLKEKKLDATDLSRLSGIMYNTLRSYVQPRSQRRPSAPNGIALAKALDVCIEWLFDDSQDFPATPYHNPPPFRITPWPPYGIRWDEAKAALNIYVHERTERYLAEANKRLANEGYELMEGPAMPIFPDEDDKHSQK